MKLRGAKVSLSVCTNLTILCMIIYIYLLIYTYIYLINYELYFISLLILEALMIHDVEGMETKSSVSLCEYLSTGFASVRATVYENRYHRCK